MDEREIDAEAKAVEGNLTWPAPELVGVPPEVPLSNVWCGGENGSHWAVGDRDWNAKRIYLSPTGQGPHGCYDQIHIETNSGARLVLNAHEVEGWTWLEVPPYVVKVDAPKD